MQREPNEGIKNCTLKSLNGFPSIYHFATRFDSMLRPFNKKGHVNVQIHVWSQSIIKIKPEKVRKCIDMFL